MPGVGKAPARPVFGNPELPQIRRVKHQRHLVLQALAPFGPSGIFANVSEVDLIDDREDRDFEQDRVQPGPAHRNVDFAVPLPLGHRDALARKVKKPKEINKVALNKAQGPKIGQLVSRELQPAQGADFFADLVQIGAQVDAGRTAAVAVLDLGSGKVMQDNLHHRELVQVGVEQGLDDHRMRQLCVNHSTSSPASRGLPTRFRRIG